MWPIAEAGGTLHDLRQSSSHLFEYSEFDEDVNRFYLGEVERVRVCHFVMRGVVAKERGRRTSKVTSQKFLKAWAT